MDLSKVLLVARLSLVDQRANELLAHGVDRIAIVASIGRRPLEPRAQQRRALAVGILRLHRQEPFFAEANALHRRPDSPQGHGLIGLIRLARERSDFRALARDDFANDLNGLCVASLGLAAFEEIQKQV